MPGVAIASPVPIGPTYDVTLTSYQENLTNGQASFDVAGPGISLHVTAIDTELSFNGLYYQPQFDPQPFSITLVLSGDSDALAQGTALGVTYGPANPLSLYLGGPGVTTTPFSFPSSAPPNYIWPPNNTWPTNYTLNTDPLITVPAVSERGFDYACTPLCADPTSIPFAIEFVPSAGVASVQFSGPGPDNSNFYAATFYPQSFSFQASPVPEPAAYGSLVLGLVALYTFAQFRRRRGRQKSSR